MLIGYARVSTRDQDLNGQVAELEAQNCEKILSEKISGTNADNRQQIAKALGLLRKDDLLIVTRLDRLARSTLDLLNIVKTVQAKGAHLRSIKDTWMDTTTPHGRLMLTVLGGIAEFERELIKARCDEGRKRAKANGVKFGRPSKLTDEQKAYIKNAIEDGFTQLELAHRFGVDPSTINRLAP